MGRAATRPPGASVDGAGRGCNLFSDLPQGFAEFGLLLLHPFLEIHFVEPLDVTVGEEAVASCPRVLSLPVQGAYRRPCRASRKVWVCYPVQAFRTALPTVINI
jgi:hypothetical protein